MRYLVDTNILLRLADRSHPMHSKIRVAIRALRQHEHTFCISSQNCIEFWNVATRPAEKNGFGLTPDKARRLLGLIERFFPVLPDHPDVYEEWRRLVITFKVSGVQVHDTRLVAAMNVNAISHILAFNIGDFTRYRTEGIIAVSPELVD